MSVRRRDLLLAGAGALGLAPAFVRASPSSRQGAPLNVLLLVLDTVRGDRYAPPHALTPRYDAFAARGVRFDRAWAHSSWSLPSHATILTGRLPGGHGADWPALRLLPGAASLAEYFGARGYVAGAFSSNSAWVTPEYLGRGFTRFQAYSLEDHLRRTTWGRVANRALQELGAHNAGRGRKAPAVHAQLLDFLARYPERPFFAYVTHMDANQALHHAKLNHPFWRAGRPVAEVVSAYDDAVTTLDRQVGELLDELERRGILERTLVVITSDHGESFGAENPGDHDPEGHGSSLYPEQTAVPLAVVHPDGRFAGRRVSAPVGIAAVPATIAGVLGGRNPFPGPSLPVDDAATAAWGDGPGVAQTLRYDRHRADAFVTARHLLVRDLEAGRDLLFDLVDDPLCRADLGPAHPAAAGLRERLAAALAAG